MMKKWFTSLCLCASVLTFGQGTDGNVRIVKPPKHQMRFDAVLSTVNGEPITLLDLLLECGGDEAALQRITNGGIRSEQLDRIRKQTLDHLIDRKLVWTDYLKYKHPIPKQMIEDALDGMATSLADGSRDGLKTKLKILDITLESLRERAIEQIATDLMVQEYCYRRVFTTPRQLDHYYHENLEKFTLPPQREIAIILIAKQGRNPDPEESAMLVDEALRRNPADFETLSAQYSDAPSADSGGVMGTFSDAELRPEFKTALDSLPPGQNLAGPLKLNEGVCFLKCLRNFPERRLAFEEVRERIRQILEAPQRKKKLDVYLDNLRRTAIIRDYSELDMVESQFEREKVKVEAPNTFVPKELPPEGAAAGQQRRVVQ